MRSGLSLLPGSQQLQEKTHRTPAVDTTGVKATSVSPAFPFIDARGNPLACADPVAVRALRDGVFGGYGPLITPTLPVLDRIARAWLARGCTPYLPEIDAVARHTRVAGVYAINMSYEYACTTVARADRPDGAPTLRRTLDWPFLGLGEAAVAVRRTGPAGDFVEVTWPGAVGTLTGVGFGRFAAAINQAPLFRRSDVEFLRGADYGLNWLRTMLNERGMPPLHLLRQTFETAPDFKAALQALSEAEVARPVLYTLIGCKPDEIAVIERRERDATVYLGPGSVANDWRRPCPQWESRPSARKKPWLDSITRCAAIEQAVEAAEEPFSWVVPPVRNWFTRVAIEMNAGEGWVRALGYEPAGDRDAAPVTAPFEMSGAGLEADL